MKLVSKNMRKLITESGLQMAEIVRRINIIQEQISPGKRPVTRNSLYAYIKGATPTEEKIYILSAILRQHPKDVFSLVINEEKLELAKKLAKELRVTI